MKTNKNYLTRNKYIKSLTFKFGIFHILIRVISVVDNIRHWCCRNKLYRRSHQSRCDCRSFSWSFSCFQLLEKPLHSHSRPTLSQTLLLPKWETKSQNNQTVFKNHFRFFIQENLEFE